MYKFHHMSLKIKFELFYENKFIQKYITLHILKNKNIELKPCLMNKYTSIRHR